jgi:hypothetical protein
MVRIFYRAATERQASGNNFAHIPNTKVQLKSSFSLDFSLFAFNFCWLLRNGSVNHVIATQEIFLLQL